MITPNQLSFARLILAFCIAYILFHTRSVASEITALILFTIASLTDWWDGHLARTKSLITPLGQIIDPIADKTLTLGMMLLFVMYGLYQWWWIVIILIREISVTTIRLMLLKQGKVIPAEQAGKVKFVFQVVSIYMTFIFLILSDGQLISKDHLGYNLIYYLHLSAIFIANILTLYSGISFFSVLSHAKPKD